MDPVAKITVRVPSPAALNEVLALVPGVSVNCGAPKDDGGGFLVDLYGTPADAAALAGSPYLVSVDDEYAKVLRARRGQVGKGDRFKGGTIPPVGLGTQLPPD